MEGRTSRFFFARESSKSNRTQRFFTSADLIEQTMEGVERNAPRASPEPESTVSASFAMNSIVLALYLSECTHFHSKSREKRNASQYWLKSRDSGTLVRNLFDSGEASLLSLEKT